MVACVAASMTVAELTAARWCWCRQLVTWGRGKGGVLCSVRSALHILTASLTWNVWWAGAGRVVQLTMGAVASGLGGVRGWGWCGEWVGLSHLSGTFSVSRCVPRSGSASVRNEIPVILAHV